jgi:hypothetical protein
LSLIVGQEDGSGGRGSPTQEDRLRPIETGCAAASFGETAPAARPQRSGGKLLLDRVDMRSRSTPEVGFGRSSQPRQVYNFGTLADDSLSALLRRSIFATLPLSAHSMGRRRILDVDGRT